MKLAITKTDFPLGVRVSEIVGGFKVAWFSESSQEPVAETELNEAFIKARCGARELTDASDIYVEIDFVGNVTRVHNKMASSLISKSNGHEYALKNGVTIGAQVYIPFADSPVSDWVLRVNGNPDIGIDVPVDTLEVAHSGSAFREFAWSIYPTIAITSTVACEDNSTEIHLQLMHKGQSLEKAGVRLYATAETGYINKREAYTDAMGIAKIRARRLDLEDGDPMRVELGFKFIKNVCHVDVP